MRRTIVILAGFLASLSIGAAVSADPDAPPVTILSCQIGATADERPAMTIEFRNEGSQQLARIIWRARVADGWLDFTDDAGAAPGVTVRRTLSWKVGVLPGYYSNDVDDCRAFAAQAIDGTQWGDLAAPDHFLETPRPDDATPVPASMDNPSKDPIGIVSCIASFDKGRTHGIGRKDGTALLGIRFRNLSSQTIDRIVFRVWYLSGGFDFIDGGSFAPHTLISSPELRRMLGQVVQGRLVRDLPATTPADYYDLSDNPSNCIAVSAHYVDGSSWQNPDVGPTEPPLPTAPPTLPPN
jgi:hypothetical protein